jgi:membrane-associated phospholipid phosphatase
LTANVVASRRGRLRRPSGEPPPLPRDPGWARWIWFGIAVLILGLVLGAVYAVAGSSIADVEDEVLQAFADLRSPAMNDLCRIVAALSGAWVIFGMRIAILAIVAFLGRFRHLVVALAAFAAVDFVAGIVRVELPRPSVDVILQPALQGQEGFFFPSPAVSSLSITLFVACYALAPAGRPRSRARIAAGVVLLLVVFARLVLGAGYPVPMLYGAVLGGTVAFLVFKWLAPDASFPVSLHRGGKAAHLDLSGARSEAVKTAMREQLGLEVTALKPFGEEGSGGSTPLLMTLGDGTRVFGKILAVSHVRSDRWYRVMRTIMYGQLEDEVPFGSVKRLIEYEDYALRVLDDLGFRVAHSYGIVELTPNREYLLVEEFFEGADTLGHAEVTDAVIDEGVALVRKLWDEGLSHRDIKPANLLVVDGHLQLIDVSGLELRPSAWRQGVDLANMLLVLALRTDAERVYARALTMFSADEIAEAVACAQGMAIPTELQAYLKQDDRDLLGQLRALAPPHAPVSIQRWSVPRIALTATAAVGLVVVLSLAWNALVAGLP